MKKNMTTGESVTKLIKGLYSKDEARKIFNISKMNQEEVSFVLFLDKKEDRALANFIRKEVINNRDRYIGELTFRQFVKHSSLTKKNTLPDSYKDYASSWRTLVEDTFDKITKDKDKIRKLQKWKESCLIEYKLCKNVIR